MLYIGNAWKGKTPRTWHHWNIKIPKPPCISSLKINGLLCFWKFLGLSEENYNLQSLWITLYHHICKQSRQRVIFPVSGICGGRDYFRTMALCQILTRYHPTSRITSCVREIRESAGNAFREPFSEVSGHCGWGTAFAIRFLPSPP